MDVQKIMPFLIAMNAPASERDEMLQLMMPTLLDIDRPLRPVISAMMGQQVLDRQRQEKRRLAHRLAAEIPDALARLSKTQGEWDDALRREFPTVTRYGLEGQLSEQVKQSLAVPATTAAKSRK